MWQLLLHIIGYFLLWLMVGIGRNDNEQIEILSKNWWIILIMMIIGTTLLKL